MSQMNRRVIATAIIAAAMSFGSVSAAFAQSMAAPDAAAPAATKSEKRAAHKQARKAHRAAKNAQLSKLEKNGYNPGTNDPTYPDKLQAAQKKAGMQ